MSNFTKPSHPVIQQPSPGKPSTTAVKPKTVVSGKNRKDDNDYEETLHVKKVSSAQSQKIRDFRSKFTMTRDDLSKAIGVNSHIVAQYENGTANFNPGEWSKINNGVDKLTREKTKENSKK
jgi:ribosome-binding protein aMBF1 (putative translation factor)